MDLPMDQEELKNLIVGIPTTRQLQSAHFGYD